MKEFIKKLVSALKVIFGYGIMICLFAGGFTFIGYLAAIIIGGDTAAVICEFIYKTLFPIIIKSSTILVLLGLLTMYLNGEKALTSSKKKASKEQGER